MATKTKPKYKASDGKTFDIKSDAERHETLVEARDTFENARDDYCKALAATQLTADGEPMTCDEWWYFKVHEYVTDPGVEKLSLHWHQLSLDENDCVQFVVWDQDRQLNRTHSIGDLFVSEKLANKRLIAVLQKNSEMNTRRIAALKADNCK